MRNQNTRGGPGDEQRHPARCSILPANRSRHLGTALAGGTFRSRGRAVISRGKLHTNEIVPRVLKLNTNGAEREGRKSWETCSCSSEQFSGQDGKLG